MPVLGKHSGRTPSSIVSTKLGLTWPRMRLTKLYTRFTHLADRKKKVTIKDLISMVLTHVGRWGIANVAAQ